MKKILVVLLLALGMQAEADQMSDKLNELGMKAMEIRDWETSADYFSQSLQTDPKQSQVQYMYGQSNRFLKNFPKAVKHLKLALELDETHKEWFLALGIALQLDGQLQESVEAFRKATAIDPDYHLPYNSAAISFRKMGDFQKAIEVYDLGITALIRNFLLKYENKRSQKVYDFVDLGVGAKLHTDYVLKALLQHSIHIGAKKLMIPTTEMAVRERETKEYEGLIWTEIETEDGMSILYLPNCFNTIFYYLASSQYYFMALENRSRAMEELGDHEGAEVYLKEAEFFKQWHEA